MRGRRFTRKKKILFKYGADFYRAEEHEWEDAMEVAEDDEAGAGERVRNGKDS